MDIESSEIKERMISLAESLNISARDFSKRIGKDPSYIKGIKKEISTDVLRNINLVFPQINIMWIITGKGKKFLSELPNNSSNDNLTSYLIEKNKELEEKNEELLMEIGRLKEQLNIIRGYAQQENDVGCVVASGSDLVR